MVMGEQTAKKKMYEEALKMAEQLENGDSDSKTLNRALAYVIRMLEGAVTTEFITEDHLKTKLTEFRSTCPVYSDFIRTQANRKKMSFSLGPLTVTGAISHISIAFMIFIFFIGKGKGWW